MNISIHPLSFALVLAASASAQTPAVEFAGVQIVAASYGEGHQAIRPFQTFDDGVKLAFIIRLPEGGLISVDDDESSITTFADDKGNSLYQKGEFKNGFGSFPSVSKDGKAAVFTLEGTVPLAADATRLIAEGNVAVKTASKKETVKGGDLAKDASLTAAGQKITVKEFDQSGGETKVGLSSGASFEPIVRIRWLDAAGKELEADSQGSGSFGLAGKMTYSQDWVVKGSPASVEFELWTDLAIIEVPFSVNVATGTGG